MAWHSTLIQSKIARRQNGNTRIYKSLGTMMEPLTSFVNTTTTIIVDVTKVKEVPAST